MIVFSGMRRKCALTRHFFKNDNELSSRFSVFLQRRFCAIGFGAVTN